MNPQAHALARLAHGKKLFVAGRPPPEVLEEVAGAYSTAVLASCDELAGMCFMLQSGLFDLYGHSGLASVNAQLHLRTRNPGTPEDGCDAYCKLAAHRFAAGDVRLARELLAEAARLFPRGTPASRLWLATELQVIGIICVFFCFIKYIPCESEDLVPFSFHVCVCVCVCVCVWFRFR